ncbi:MAG TPA: M56 family metallopeptidase [Candidatus Angelobacter sp.]|nr:M56 family metallopeptidase [Candidatus Angelobacter sp.]
MNFPASIHSIAPIAAERLLFSLGIGTLLAVMVWLLLYLLPKRDSRTSFAVWFSTLLVTALLPLPGLYLGRGHGTIASAHAAVTVSSSWAVGIFLVWASVTVIGLARVALALLQVHRLRSKSTAVDLQTLSPESAALITEFRRSRPVELLASKELEVPTAIGFFKPAVVLPEWLLQGTPAEKLKFIILHELAHLRRRDDWTNLAQQIVKAFLFFLPSVWWIEQKLSLDREMACDDAVLAHSGTPREYAECLAHVAERSFLRRQLAMAQAAVTRLRQLTTRVTKILDPSRPQPSQLWKPAIPTVVVVAGLCVFSASHAPMLISFTDSASTANVLAAQTASNTHAMQNNAHALQIAATKPTQSAAATKAKFVAANFNDTSSSGEPKVRAWNAALKSGADHQKAATGRPAIAIGRTAAKPQRRVPEKLALNPLREEPTKLMAKTQQPVLPSPEFVTVREEFLMVVGQGPQAVMQSWQLRIVEISVVTAQTQQKTVPRKI